MAKNKEVAIVSQNMSIERVIQNAIDKNVPVETMERLLAMRQQLKAEAAKEAYNRDMAEFQSDCPTIQKTKEVISNGRLLYKYAPIESIVQQVQPFLRQYGFSFSTSMELKENTVRVVCKVTHREGHSEESPMEVPLGNKTSAMSDTQVTAAASTFAKRYAFCNAFGILTGDEDTDAKPVETPKMAPYSVEKRPYPPFTEKNDAAPFTSPSENKIEIASLLEKNYRFTMKGKTKKQVEDKVFDITGLLLTEENYPELISRLSVTE